jgi:hypothetical protein
VEPSLLALAADTSLAGMEHPEKINIVYIILENRTSELTSMGLPWCTIHIK